MATDNVDDKGQSKPQEGDGLNQADANALENADLAKLNEESDPRLAMMKRAREKRAEETGSEITAAEDGGEPPKRATPKNPDDDDAGAKPPAGGTSTSTTTEAAKVEMADDAVVELMVNGKPEKMTWGDAKKSLQLGAATEETLRQAKETREAANRELEAAAAVRKVLGDGGAKPATGEPAAKTEEEKRKDALKAAEDRKRTARRDYAKAAQYGTEAEVEKATTDLEAAEDEVDKLRYEAVQPAPQRDPLLDREVADTNRGTADYVKEFGEDQKEPLFRAAVGLYLREENIADLTKLGADENVLRKLTDQELGEHHFRARSRGLVRTVDKVLFAAGNKAREELGKRSAPAAKPAANAREERESKKHNAPGQPKAAAGRVPEPEEAQRPTGSALVAEALKRRGKA